MRNPQCWATMGPILACGDTNAAVDNLVEGLVNRKLRVVRLGQPAKVRGSAVSGRRADCAAQSLAGGPTQYPMSGCGSCGV